MHTTSRQIDEATFNFMSNQPSTIPFTQKIVCGPFDRRAPFDTVSFGPFWFWFVEKKTYNLPPYHLLGEDIHLPRVPSKMPRTIYESTLLVPIIMLTFNVLLWPHYHTLIHKGLNRYHFSRDVTIFVNLRLSQDCLKLKYGPQQHGLMFGSSYLNHLDMSSCLSSWFKHPLQSICILQHSPIAVWFYPCSYNCNCFKMPENSQINEYSDGSSLPPKCVI